MPPEQQQQPQQECMQQQNKKQHLIVSLHGKRTVVPINPSQTSIQSVSTLDSIMGNFYLHKVYFFDAPFEDSLENLNASLSTALGSFQFMCGRLRVLNDGNLGIKLNDAGIRAQEATSTANLSDWIKSSNSQASITMLCPSEIHISDYSISPLVGLQYTRFRCGGMAIGVSWCHILGGFSSMACFMKIWGEAHARQRNNSDLIIPTINRGLDNSKFRIMEEIFRAHAQGKLSMFSQENNAPLETRIFHIPEEAPSGDSSNILSDSEAALCANLWKSIAKAREIPASESTRFLMWMDEADQSSESYYFGNSSLAFHSVDANAGEIASKSTIQVAKMIQEQIQHPNHPHKNYNSKNGSCSSQNVVFCCWASSVQCSDVDFGLNSMPVKVDCAAESLFGEAIVSVVSNCVSISLRPDAMKRLPQDATFLAPSPV